MIKDIVNWDELTHLQKRSAIRSDRLRRQAARNRRMMQGWTDKLVAEQAKLANCQHPAEQRHEVTVDPTEHRDTAIEGAVITECGVCRKPLAWA